MEIKQLIHWSLKHWWWFIISWVLCAVVGVFYYCSTVPTREVSAVIMLRTADGSSQQGELMTMMGVSATKQAADEIKILTSRELMAQIVDSLHLTTIVTKKQGLRWVPQYPCPDFALALEDSETKVLKYKQEVDGEQYKIKKIPRLATIDMMLHKLNIARLNRESQVITISTVSDCPQQAIDIINLLLELYNQSSVTDKYQISIQAKTFLDERIAGVEEQLHESEMLLENYKSTHRIADLDKTAVEYQKQIDNLQQEMADVDLEDKSLEKLENQLRIAQKNNLSTVVFADVEDGSLEAMIIDYNRLVEKRASLMQGATESNPAVVTLDASIAQVRSDLIVCVQEARKAIELRNNHLTTQEHKYTDLLASIPEQERTYLEMLRAKQTTEEQYIYLVQKREENALLLASSTLFAKIIDPTQMAAKLSSPRLSHIGLIVILIGLLLPLLLYFTRLFYNEIR